MDPRGVVSWEAVNYSSQELPHKASNLNSASSANALRRLLVSSAGLEDGAFEEGWRSEKFCEYPQELVFRVSPNSGSYASPTIHSIVIVADPTLIPKRIEIFLSTTTAKQWRKAAFHRLGYITLRSPQETQCAAQELKTVPIQQGSAASESITYVRLLVHSCHVHKANVFNQVGLSCAVALSEPLDTTQRHEEDTKLWEGAPLQERRHAAVDEHTTLNMGASSSLPTLSSTSSSAIWDAEVGEYVTPTQILTRIQLARERHGVIVQSTLHTDGDLVQFQEGQRLWLLEERGCKQLSDKLGELQSAEALSRTVGDRLEIRKQLDSVLKSLGQLVSRVHLREADMQRNVSRALITQLANSPVKTTKQSLRRPLSKPVFSRPDWPKLEQWQSREEFVWRVVEAVKLWVERDEKKVRIRKSHSDEEPEVLNEALQIATTGLDDGNPQVFVAANALLTIVLTHHPRFHDSCAWKHDVVALIKQLSKRLDDHQPIVRNNAAFSIVKIAEQTRASGSFVLHNLLQLTEKQELQLIDQALYGVIKVVSALLQAFHCCATIDVSHKRVLKLLLTSDALIHENGHVREAAHELLVVLHGEVGGEVIVEFFRKKKLPIEAERSVEELFSVLAQKQVQAPSKSLDDTATTANIGL